ncbi:MAG: hypothetical protein V1846_05415 [Candidatus Komeilibacteria bacterium]
MSKNRVPQPNSGIVTAPTAPPPAPPENAWEFAIDDQNGVDSTMWVRWCLKPAGAAFFKAVGLNPLVLIVVAYPDRPYLEQRFLVEAEKCMERIWLRRPGEVKIHAVLLWRRETLKNGRITDDYPRIWKSLMIMRNSIYNTSMVADRSGDLVNHSGEFQRTDFCRNQDMVKNLRFDSFSFSVKVAQEMFAPEPPAWEKKWLNRYNWFGKPADQCKFRKMRMIGWPFVTLIFPFEFILKWWTAWVNLIAGILVGQYDLDVRPLILPWKYPFGWVWHNARGRDLEDVAFFFRPYRLPFSPAALLLYYGFWRAVVHLKPSLSLLGLVLLTGVIAAALVAVVTLIRQMVRGIKKKMADAEREVMHETPEPRIIPVPVPRFVSVPSAVCLGGLKAEPFTPQVLDKKARTVHLGFVDLKGKVCKPYAQ